MSDRKCTLRSRKRPSPSLVETLKSEDCTSSNEEMHYPKYDTTKKNCHLSDPSYNDDDDDEDALFEYADGSNKNAILARINRRKKKMYIESLQKQDLELTRENLSLKHECVELHAGNESLKTEAAYLRSVLSNQDTLAKLLVNIPHVTDVRLSSSICSGKKSDSCGKDCVSSRAMSSTSVDAGVCLHVCGNTVSMEFCSNCALLSKN